MIPYKTCTACHAMKPLEDYYRNNGTADGLLSTCRDCHRHVMRERQRDNPERNRQSVEKWRRENPEKNTAQSRRYYAQHRDEIVEKRRIYREQNREHILAVANIWRQKNRERYRDKWLAKGAAYRERKRAARDAALAAWLAE